MAGLMPSWAAHDLRLMLARFHVDGMLGKPGAAEILTGLLGHPPRRYRDLAVELARPGRRGEGMGAGRTARAHGAPSAPRSE